MVVSARRDRDGIVSVRRREMHGVRNGIRSAAGLEGGGGTDGDEDGVASARGIAVWLRRRDARRQGRRGAVRSPEAAPVFPKKSPDKYF